MGFRNPITTASAVDTGQGGNAGVRLYQGLAAPGVPQGIAEWRTGLMAKNATAILSGGGSGGSSLVIYGGQPGAVALDAPTLELDVLSAPLGGYESVAKIVNCDRLEVPKLKVMGTDAYNAGTSGVLAGTAPAAGRALLVKTFAGSLVGNASGDVTVTFPGGAFPNGLVGLAVNAVPAAAGAFMWLPWSPSLSAVNLRCFQSGSSVAVANPTLIASVIAYGW
jgi:hypothetical protein